MPTLRGRVIEKWSGVPVGGAVVVVNGMSVIADSNGNFSIDTPYPTASIQVLHTHHESVSEMMAMAVGGDTTVEIILTPIARAL